MRTHPDRFSAADSRSSGSRLSLRRGAAVTRRVGRVPLVALLAMASTGLGVVGCAPNIEELRAAGVQQYRNHQYVESMASMRHVLDLDKSDAPANYYMGLNYRMLAGRRLRDGDVPSAFRQLDIATIYFTQAVKSWPNYMAAISAKNDVLELRGKYDQALNVAENVTANNRGVAEHFIFLGNEYRERADYDNALLAYKKALAIDPTSARAFASVGKLYLRIGDRDLAADAFRKAYELDPAEPTSAEALAQLETELEPQYDTYPASHEMSQ